MEGMRVEGEIMREILDWTAMFLPMKTWEYRV
jgi:hypothetical protein